MAGTAEADESSFVWDEKSQLYFHASSGFYHDPVAGWYYSSRDGLYYKFENGNYVLLGSDSSDEGEVNQSNETCNENPSQVDEPSAFRCSSSDANGSAFQGDESEAYQCVGTANDEHTLGDTECSNGHASENPPPSEWLEDTLIDLYLSGYSKPVVTAADDVTMLLETKDMDNFKLSVEAGNSDTSELEGEWLPESHCGVNNSSGSVLDEGASWDEENWRAQYGQVIQSEQEPMPEFPVVDLWDWATVTGSRKDGKGEVVRLVGRLVRRSVKLHPSMPGGGLLKTASICKVHLDLVRVTSGQVYKLRTPNAGYLASLSTYDSSNPTKDWGFPELSVARHSLPLSKSGGKHVSKTVAGVSISTDTSMLPDNLSASEKHKINVYRDRAAERRILHGGFGVGPGQKNSIFGENDLLSSPASASTEEAAAEALNISFGAGSYARKLLESMGWKEGEGLGNTTKGLVEPIQAVGNVGNAGLGWPQGIAKQPPR